MASDIHEEVAPPGFVAPVSDADPDIVVLAGDVSHANGSVSVARGMFPSAPIVMIGGNHEHYSTGLTIDQGMDVIRGCADRWDALHGTSTRILEDAEEVVTVNGIAVRFIGATLWTDFALHGEPHEASAVAARALKDFVRIKGRSEDPGNILGILARNSIGRTEWSERHETSREFIRARLEARHDGPTIVVTHHLPSMRSIARERRPSSPVNAAFASNMDDVVEMGAALWVHGHTHSSRRWRAWSGTMVLCNPLGYTTVDKAGTRVSENDRFDGRLVVVVRRDPATGTWKARVEPGARKPGSDGRSAAV